ncbi:MAG: alanine--tRNA ligase [Chthoniobacterales bacterium]
MTSSELRRSFLDFFSSKEHTILPSSSLLPDSPNLLFTNAGMNQFVPIFLGTTPCSFTPARAADVQKCIRAGGKHNDLEDVGLDTYHHTFFEMLGNWSFGDYFKKEAINWAWELMVDRWKFPPQRLYATVYQPAEGDPASFDGEAYDLWAAHFLKAGLDPAVHIVPGNRKDNFWMMGETGPCGPCSELHVDLTPYGDTKGLLVNKGTAECIEIWNLVFIQFNAQPDGTFVPLPSCHVDTGMGFERICSIIQGTRNFQEFGNVIISNYETDLFRPIFSALEKMCGHRYGSTLPQREANGTLVPMNAQEKIDVAFRVIADHLRTLGFAIADGIEPGNSERNYVLRRILRRAVRYGRTLGFSQPFFYQLVPTLVSVMGDAFPEVRKKQAFISDVLRREEEAFHRTLDKGLALFESEASLHKEISGAMAFRLYDEQGFPLDLTELLARERGLSVDHVGFEKLMEEQRARARAAQKKTIIDISSITTKEATDFVGFDQQQCDVCVSEVVQVKNKTALIFNRSVCYAEMGGQVGDTGMLQIGSVLWRIMGTQKYGNIWLHFIDNILPPLPNAHGTLLINAPRRRAIERHHTATHLLHWALHQIVGGDVSQKGSSVTAEKLTFDFNSTPLTSEQLRAIEHLVNEEVLKNSPVSWFELPYAEVKEHPEIMQFFGDKYGDVVRVIQIGGEAKALNGFSMELCAGTHVRATGEIGFFKIVSEGAVAAGIRRIEAVAGLVAYEQGREETSLIHRLAEKLRSPLTEVEEKLDATLLKNRSLEKELQLLQQQLASATAEELLKKSTLLGRTPIIIETIPEADASKLQCIASMLKGKFEGVLLLAGLEKESVSLMAAVSENFKKQLPAGKLIQAIAPLIDGKGGGSPDAARGAGRNLNGLTAALAKARELVLNSTL